ncbi:dienelactone hydrolase family protein [Sporosarcina sp. CAU 1771]
MTFKEIGSNTAIVVVHEIYGVNQHIIDYSELLRGYNLDVYCPNLLKQDLVFDYSEEKAAYTHFKNNVGFSESVKQVTQLIMNIKKNYEKVILIGFSVGATIAWLCSKNNYVHGVVAYYGSRIRDYIDLIPDCPTLLFFPKEENNFNVNKLIDSLYQKNITSYQFQSMHGFSDSFSKHYNELSAKKTYELTIAFISENSSG